MAAAMAAAGHATTTQPGSQQADGVGSGAQRGARGALQPVGWLGACLLFLLLVCQ
jgi:hypothetical protein